MINLLPISRLPSADLAILVDRINELVREVNRLGNFDVQQPLLLKDGPLGRYLYLNSALEDTTTTPGAGVGDHGVSLEKNGLLVPNVASTAIPWNVQEWDTDGYHSGSSTDVVVPTAQYGTYLLTVNFIWFGSGVLSSDLELQMTGTIGSTAFALDKTYLPGNSTITGAPVISGAKILRMISSTSNTLTILARQNHSAVISMSLNANMQLQRIG